MAGIKVNVHVSIDDGTLNRCLQLIEMWLADNPDKTLVIEEEDGIRVCLIAERSK